MYSRKCNPATNRLSVQRCFDGYPEVWQFHSTPEPDDIPPEKDDPLPPDIPDPEHAPIKEPTPPEVPIKTRDINLFKTKQFSWI